MKITFDSITLENFKGIEKVTAKFNEGLNIISGPNGSGKTTVIDAIYWCLFGKNQEDKKKFVERPFLQDGSLKEIDLTSVALNISIDGQAHELKRTVKNSKSAMFIDDVPKKMNEFNEFVEENMFSPDDFKMFVNPSYFSETLHWKKQRELLMKYFDMPGDKEVLEVMTEKKVKPGKLFMDEVELKTPEDILEKYELELKTEEAKSEKYSNQIELLDEQIEGFQGDDDVEILKEKRDRLKGEISDASRLQEEAQKAIATRNNRANSIAKLETQIEIGKEKIKAYGEERPNPNIEARKSDIKILESSKARYIDEWKELNKTKKSIADDYNKKLEDADGTCPTCGQLLPEDQIEAIKAKLNKQMDTELNNLQTKLDANVEKGKATATKIEGFKEQLAEEEKTPFIKSKVPDGYTEKLAAYKEQLAELKATEVPEIPEVPDVSETREEYERLNDFIGQYDAIEKSKTKRQELIDEKKQIAIRLEDIDKCLKDASRFITYRTEMIVKKVNRRFENISLKLFETLKNGKVKETFEITRKGVPYSEDNATGKVAAGFELLSFLKGAMDINTPVIIDNFERYPSIDLSNTDSQVIVVKAVEGKADVVGSFEVI